jgi:hypothetical protein
MYRCTGYLRKKMQTLSSRGLRSNQHSRRGERDDGRERPPSLDFLPIVSLPHFLSHKSPSHSLSPRRWAGLKETYFLLLISVSWMFFCREVSSTGLRFG